MARAKGFTTEDIVIPRLGGRRDAAACSPGPGMHLPALPAQGRTSLLLSLSFWGSGKCQRQGRFGVLAHSQCAPRPRIPSFCRILLSRD